MKSEGSKPTSALSGEPFLGAAGLVVSQPRILREQLFHKLLRMEKKRAYRANRSIMLMVLDVDLIDDPSQRAQALSALASVLPEVLRLTDIKGWYEKDSSLGILFTEMGYNDPRLVKGKVTRKIASAILQSGPVSWKGFIGVTTWIFDDGGEPEVESSVLELSSPKKSEDSAVQAVNPSLSPGNTIWERLPLISMDLVCIPLCLLLISWSRTWNSRSLGVDLSLEFLASAVVLLSVTLLFEFYKTERLPIGSKGFLRVAQATSAVAVASILFTVVSPDCFPHPDLFLAQTLITWFIVLSWKIIYARHQFRTRFAKALWVENRNIL